MDSTYQDDLTYIHHEGFGDLARGAAPGQPPPRRLAFRARSNRKRR